MEKKTILIAETNKPQDKFIKDALMKSNINIEILDADPLNSEEMKDAILTLKPDIVITNERKKDKPASDVIQEIQENKTLKQPIFIVVSAYESGEMKYTLYHNGIVAYTIYKPYDFNDLANCIKSILNDGIEMKDDWYENWKERYYNKRFIEIEKYLTKSDFDLFDNLGIKVEKKIYTEYEFELLNMDLLAYYDDPEQDLSEEEKQYQKSLDGTNVSREEYNKLLEKINEINKIYNL